MVDGEQIDTIPYWKARGWTVERQGQGVEVYSGKYKVFVSGEEKVFKGFVVLEKVPGYSIGDFTSEARQEAKVFMEDPPEEIKNHPHGSCLGLASQADQEHGALFTLHFTRAPQDADSAIKFMEGMLQESFNPKQ